MFFLADTNAICSTATLRLAIHRGVESTLIYTATTVRIGAGRQISKTLVHNLVIDLTDISNWCNWFPRHRIGPCMCNRPGTLENGQLTFHQ